MEHQQILSLLIEANNSNFVTRKWNIGNDNSRTNYVKLFRKKDVSPFILNIKQLVLIQLLQTLIILNLSSTRLKNNRTPLRKNSYFVQ